MSVFLRFGCQIDFANAQLGEVFLLKGSLDYQFTDHLNVNTSHSFNTLEFDGGFQNDNFKTLLRDRRTLFAKFSYAWQG